MVVELGKKARGSQMLTRCQRVACFLFFASCAKVGDPLPPLASQPATVIDLELVQIGSHVRLTFSQPVGQIRRVEVYRVCGVLPQMSEQTEPMAVINLDDLLPTSVEGKYLFRDDPTFSERCGYGLRFVDSHGERSAFSNSVYTEPIYPAKPPTRLTYEVLEEQIRINWDPPTENVDGSRPPRILGYLVNSQRFVPSTSLVDDEFQFGTKLSYSVQTVSRRSQPLVVSEASETLTLIPKDEFSPATPANLSALNIQGKVQLLWDVNREADVEGYFIYRGTRSDRMEKSSQLTTINVYLDESVTAGQTYFYQVSARDTSGNESSRSPSVSIRVE